MTSVTLKSRSNQKLVSKKIMSGIMPCILTRCTYDKHLEMIQPLVKKKYQFVCFWVWPPGGQAKNQIGPKFGL
jgi:hypothetical protein